MFRMRVGVAVVGAAVGALLLSACGLSGGGGTPAASATASSGSGSGADAAVAHAQNPLLQDLSTLFGTAKEHNAPAHTGDFADAPGKPATKAGQAWVQLSVSKAGGLDPVVVNGAGFTLYRFDKDTPDPSASNCSGACATTWPPVIVSPSGKVFLDGVKSAGLGALRRQDGTLQLTLNGWPMYRYSGDLAPGDANGEGVDGTWFGITPYGGKAGAPTTVSGSGGGSTSGEPATNAVLFDDTNFNDNGSQGVSGKGCQNVSRPGVASSLQTDGSLTIWSGPGCTGTSAVVNGNVSDLSAIGFDNRIASVNFG